MQLMVNGEPRDISEAMTLDALLRDMNIDSTRVATLVNDHVVRRNDRATIVLKDGDRVEAFTFACGG